MKTKLFFLLIFMLLLIAACNRETAPDPGECTDLAREFLVLLTNKEYLHAVSMFNSIMKNMLPEKKLAKTWEEILGQVGEYEDEITFNTWEEDQFTTVVITNRFAYIPVDMKVVFNPRKKITGLWFLPPYSAYDSYTNPVYVSPDQFIEEEVVFGLSGWKLPGTLSLPVTGESGPAVILVHGSGPQDRDETIGPNKPFKDIAWGLASKGIAVLRYEKRTMKYPAKCAAQIHNFTVKEETIDDVLAAVSFLKTRKEINAKKIFILGHSLGGMLIPRIAQKDPDSAGYIILAGPTRPFDLLILEQTEYLAGLDDNITEKERNEIEDLKKKVTRLKTGDLTPDTPPEELPLGIPALYWLDLKGYMPHVLVAESTRPFLILQGGRDYQVTKQDFLGWEKSLKGKENVKLIFYDTLNHLFITGQGKSMPTEYYEQGHVDEKVIRDIISWIKTGN